MARKRVSQIAGALGLLFGWADIAAAQPQAGAVVPPRVDRVTQVPYPPGGEGNASVVLVLTIDKDGTVRSAEVERGDEPFATVAREAATSWRFTPATRDGAPVLRTLHAAIVDDALVFHAAPIGEKMETLGRACVVSARSGSACFRRLVGIHLSGCQIDIRRRGIGHAPASVRGLAPPESLQ